MKALSWINFLMGVWLIAAGFVLSSGSRPFKVEEMVFGIAIACLAAISVAHPSSAISLLVAIAGLGTVLAPTTISYGRLTAAHMNALAVGVAVLILGIANAAYRQYSPQIQA